MNSSSLPIEVLAGLKPDDLVKSLNSMAKQKSPNSRRANPEE
jgi:hypothetical protein